MRIFMLFTDLLIKPMRFGCFKSCHSRYSTHRFQEHLLLNMFCWVAVLLSVFLLLNDFICKHYLSPYCTAMGSCLAMMNYESIVSEELSFQEGDKIEIIGYFIECMEWFLGRHVFTGQIGFVQTGHVKLDLSKNKWVIHIYLS